MKTEFETKFVGADFSKVRKTLKSLGAKPLGKREFRRIVVDLPPKGKTWVRLRTDGKKTTLTAKTYLSGKVDGTKEVEVSVGDFGKTLEILRLLGLPEDGIIEVESTRESYRLGKVSIDLDTWPKLPPIVEIEGPDKKSVERTILALGIPKERTTSKTHRILYRKLLGIRIDDYRTLGFKGLVRRKGKRKVWKV